MRNVFTQSAIEQQHKHGNCLHTKCHRTATQTNTTWELSSDSVAEQQHKQGNRLHTKCQNSHTNRETVFTQSVTEQPHKQGNRLHSVTEQPHKQGNSLHAKRQRTATQPVTTGHKRVPKLLFITSEKLVHFESTQKMQSHFTFGNNSKEPSNKSHVSRKKRYSTREKKVTPPVCPTGLLLLFTWHWYNCKPTMQFVAFTSPHPNSLVIVI